MMNKEDIFLKKRWEELAYKSFQNNRYYFTGFLSLEEIALLKETFVHGEGSIYSLYSGSKSGERAIARFGNPEEFLYEEDYPICILEAAPLIEKFADDFSHRDFLGAIMNLGIEREMIGDIVLCGKRAYIFAHVKMADYIKENLVKVKHTNILVREISEIPVEMEKKLKEEQISVSSLRIDAVLAKSHCLARNAILEHMREKKVFLNGRVCENPDCRVKEGDILVLRGYGKLCIAGELYENKKGKKVVLIQKFV